ncbi:50S ribosomal protein L21 [Candidatus Curtissbacteria bacterium RIFCSPLOWO2_01_FULL_42_26]|uniref:Large ribosomal subunit protein bL21 n=1 Tax=Candidatus Curtissbacteria bacterium RIFCSPLOWO2_01_FULL_42_26 TaxID=1797729 RepID=A0A1F5I338_9BACT|nr:MAG: 50S ribosomal protein L21 [Candidatus Curtissbacteria bacterium RIFCSPLOWO2_01_FULL_42_26]
MNTWVVIKTGGKQYKVAEGEIFSAEKIKGQNKNSIIFETVLALSSNGQIKVGSPYLADVKVKAKILDDYKEKKIRVVQFRAKSRYLRTRGHRHQKTKLLIEKILQ